MDPIAENLFGTSEEAFQIDVINLGPLLKHNATALEARNSDDTDYAITRGADPIDANDYATKGYVDLSFGFPWQLVPAGTSVLIPENRQHLTSGEVVIEGEIIVEGEMVVI